MNVLTGIRSLLRRWWLWTCLGLIAAYAIAGFWLVPRLIVSGTRDFVATHYHRTATIGAVEFNPFTLELTIRGVALPDADGGPLLSFERLYVRVRFLSLLRLSPDLTEIAIDQPRLRLVRRANGSINAEDLALPADPKAPKPDPNAPPPRLSIDRLAVSGGEATVIDQTRAEPLTLTFQPITFTLTDFYTRAEGNHYALTATSTRGESLDWQGTFGLHPVESAGRFAVSRVQSRTLADVAGNALPFALTGGELSLHGNYSLAERNGALDVSSEIAELAITGLGIRARGDAADMLRVPRFVVSDTKFDLMKHRVDVGHVLVDKPVLHVVRAKDGSLSIMRLAGTASSSGTPAEAARPAPAPASGSAAPAWVVSAPDLQLAAADVSIEDQGPRQPAHLHLAPLDVRIGGFSLPAGTPLAVDVASGINDTGHIAINGTAGYQPLDGTLKVTATALPLTAAQPYVDDSTAMTIQGGAASAAGTLHFDAKGAVTFDGSAAIDGLSTVDQVQHADFINWKSLRLGGLKLRAAPFRLAIATIDADAPFARVIIEADGSTNIKSILTGHPAKTGDTTKAPPGPAPKAPQHAKHAAPPAQALPVSIGIVRVAKATADFSDFSIKPNFATGIQELSGTIKGLSGQAGTRADVNLAGKVDRYAPVTITGKINPFAAVAYTDLNVAFKNLELTSLSPYSGRFAGYKIERGKLSVDLTYLIDDRKLDAKQKIIVNQLQLGERVDSPDATSLPVKFAIALLKDRNGVIDLDLPMGGSLDDPTFKIWPLVRKIIFNVIEKAVLAPFSALASLFGGGEDTSYVDFAAGSATLDAPARTKLAAIAKGLDAHPAINIDIPSLVAPDADRPALAAARWEDFRQREARTRLGAHATDATVAQLLATPKDYRSLLEGAYRSGFGHKPDLPKAAPGTDATAAAIDWLEAALKGRIQVADADLDGLARQRSAAVQAALLDGTGIDPSRVFVIAGAPLAPNAPLRMQLAMH